VYDGKLNTAALALMRWAPLVFFLFGYWIMGNKQIFNNTVVAIDFKNVPTIADHNGWPWDSNGPAIPLFFFFIFFCLGMLLDECLAKQLKKCGLASEFDDVEVDENLGNYFETLPGFVRKSWFTTEVYNTNKLGIKMMGLGAYEQMRTIKGKRKILKNSPNYEILSNPAYVTAFQYVPVQERDNIEEASTSDMVTSMLYMGFKKENFAGPAMQLHGTGKKNEVRRKTLKKAAVADATLN
jgi:hypothetical protein